MLFKDFKKKIFQEKPEVKKEYDKMRILKDVSSFEAYAFKNPYSGHEGVIYMEGIEKVLQDLDKLPVLKTKEQLEEESLEIKELKKKLEYANLEANYQRAKAFRAEIKRVKAERELENFRKSNSKNLEEKEENNT